MRPNTWDWDWRDLRGATVHRVLGYRIEEAPASDPPDPLDAATPA